MKKSLAFLFLGIFITGFVFGLDVDDLDLSDDLNLSGLNLSQEEIAKIYNENKENVSLDNLTGRLSGSDVGRYLGNASCNFLKSAFEQGNASFEIPREIPFTNDIFTVFVDDEFMISIEIEEKKIENIYCEVHDGTTYKIYLTSDLLTEAISDYKNINLIDFYLERKKSGDLIIKPIGITRKFKMFFINIGLRFASLFS